MLSRTAEYLYWISRYMERAETNARLLDVGYRMSLFPNPNGYNNEWESVLAAAGACLFLLRFPRPLPVSLRSIPHT